MKPNCYIMNHLESSMLHREILLSLVISQNLNRRTKRISRYQFLKFTVHNCNSAKCARCKRSTDFRKEGEIAKPPLNGLIQAREGIGIHWRKRKPASGNTWLVEQHYNPRVSRQLPVARVTTTRKVGRDADTRRINASFGGARERNNSAGFLGRVDSTTGEATWNRNEPTNSTPPRICIASPR